MVDSQIRRLKVGITGTNNTGKSTLANAMHVALKERGVRADVAHESVRECPLGTKGLTSVESAAWILLRQMQIEIVGLYHDDVLLADKTALDTLAYGEWCVTQEGGKNRDGQHLIEWLSRTALEWSLSYDCLLYLPVGEGTAPPAWHQGVDHQAAIDRLILQYLQELPVPQVSVGCGDLQERLGVALDFLSRNAMLP